MPPDRKSIFDYLTITSGVVGRLALSLVYFLVIANALSVADFGVFAAAAAVGLVLSRLLGFGFISPVYRTATVKPRLIGVYLAGLLLLSVMSAPLIAAIAWGVHDVFFGTRLPLALFLLVIAAEVLGGRVMEFSVITLNGLSRFGPAMRLAVLASGLRTLSAVAFYVVGYRSLEAWAWFNLVAALGGAAAGLLFFMPRPRLRFRLAIYLRRLRDAVMTAASELAFYAQAELDKVVVLTIAGERAAGVYAIAMRLIDLTAVPVRSFNQLLVQRRMRDRREAAPIGRQLAMEAGVAAVSIAGLMAIAFLLWPDPGLLGANVARAAPLLLPLLLVPAFRNLVEFHGELLYAQEMFTTRLALLCGLTVLKLGLLAALLSGRSEAGEWALPLTVVFAAVYAASAAVTYAQLRRPRA
ncbi:MAG: oligosaccharide flippase family protein [Beijerinckiaceae bacterium]